MDSRLVTGTENAVFVPCVSAHQRRPTGEETQNQRDTASCPEEVSRPLSSATLVFG